MMTYKAFSLAILILPQVWGQARPSIASCLETGASFCEVRVASLAATGSLTVDTVNASVSVNTWGGPDILVRAEIRATAVNETLAAELAGQVVVDTSEGEVSVRGPSGKSDESWSVKLKIDVPAATALTMTTVNGGIRVRGVAGAIVFDAMNGGVRLSDVVGDVAGNAMNGSIFIAAGSPWVAQTLDVNSFNGSIDLEVPADCAAHVTASAANGNITTHLPVEIAAGEHRVSFDLGTPGSSTITASAANGSVVLRQE